MTKNYTIVSSEEYSGNISVGGQTAGIDKMAKPSQGLAMMAGQLSEVSKEIFQLTD